MGSDARPLAVPLHASRGASAAFLAVCAAATALLVLDFYHRHILKHVVERYDIDGQRNFASVTQATVLAAAALVALSLALRSRPPIARLALVLLAAVLTFLAADKALSIHEAVGRHAADALNLPRPAGRVLWQVVWSPLLLMAFSVLAVLAINSGRPVALWILAMFGASLAKLLMEAFMFPAIHVFGVSEGGLLYGIEVELEETLQLLGFGALLAGLVHLALMPDPPSANEAPLTPVAPDIVRTPSPQ